MKDKLEEIFWEGNKFINEKGGEINPKPISKPYSMKLSFNEDERKKQILDFVNTDICFTYKGYRLDINAYHLGTRANNDNGTPIQFYKI